MQQDHIILRTIQPTNNNMFLGGAATANISSNISTGLTVEVVTVNRANLPALTRNSDVVAVAPDIPIKLIEPLEIQDILQPGALPITWGVQAVGADTSPFSGDGIVVAVLDTGIDATHPAFAGVTLIEQDFTGEGNGDRNGHGTHCAGTIFGRDINGVRIGVARGIKKALIGKVIGENGGSSANIINAIHWAIQNGANVISMSLGIDFPGLVEQLKAGGMPVELATSRALEGYRANVQLFEKMAQFIHVASPFFQTTLLIAAAGNESRRDVSADFEIAVSPPAVSDGFISVAALGQNGINFAVAPFSNTGAMIAGPGVAIQSAKAGGGLVSMSGTSMATPHVAGVAALWAEQLRSVGMLTPNSLAARLIASGVTSRLNSNFDPFDVGTGMVRSPQ